MGPKGLQGGMGESVSLLKHPESLFQDGSVLHCKGAAGADGLAGSQGAAGEAVC